ncbi:MAG: Polyribonucleotide nucleotidyltransferase [Phycisphaerales bacterium]|nr:Polyribonucleotide nucleotidyltransferase [Phycisphaerales bacterium]
MQPSANDRPASTERASITTDTPGPGSTATSAPASAPTHAAKPSGPAELSADMAAEIDAAMADMMKEGAAAAPAKSAPAAGAAPAGSRPAIRGPRVVQAGREMRSGKVVAVGPTDIFVEFGPKELGVVSRTQYPNEADLPKVGDMVDVVVQQRDADGLIVCARPGAVQKADWELLEPGQTVEAKVVGVNKGGLELEVAGHRAFMPAGQVSIDRIPDLSVMVGEKLTCVVTRVDRAGRGNIVLSRRDLLAEERKKKAESLKATLAEGQVLDGVVRKIMPFGVFVDIGGLDGLVHVSDLTYDRVAYGEKGIAKYAQEGQAVKVQVLKIDLESDRISLGMKQVQGDPFAQTAGSLTEGADVMGRVKNIAEFGAFIELAPGVEGLVHISEIDHKRVNKVSDVLKPDEVVQARILKIDSQTRRISLSIKALKPLPEISMGGGGDGGKPGGGGGGGPGRGGFGGGGGGGGGGGRGGRNREPMRSAEEILKETPALRRAREKNRKMQFKGGLG